MSEALSPVLKALFTGGHKESAARKASETKVSFRGPRGTQGGLERTSSNIRGCGIGLVNFWEIKKKI